MVAFSAKAWQDEPSTATKINAAGLIDLETRLAGYTDTQVATVAATPDATSGVKGKVQLAGHLSGTAASPTVVDVAAALKDPVAGTAGLRTLGTGAAQALPGNHASTTNARSANGITTATSKGIAAGADPTTGQALVYNGTTWAPATLSMAGGPIWECNPQQVDSRASASVLTSARRPTFYPVLPPSPSYVLWGFRIIVGTNLAASTVGISLYAVTMSGSKTGTMTKVTGSQVQASGATAGLVDTALASPITLDFANNIYFVGSHASNVGTLTLVNNSSPVAGVYGAQIMGTSAPTQLADTATATWPATINILASPTNSTSDAGSAGAAAKHCWVALLTAAGANY